MTFSPLFALTRPLCLVVLYARGALRGVTHSYYEPGVRGSCAAPLCCCFSRNKIQHYVPRRIRCPPNVSTRRVLKRHRPSYVMAREKINFAINLSRFSTCITHRLDILSRRVPPGCIIPVWYIGPVRRQYVSVEKYIDCRTG